MGKTLFVLGIFVVVCHCAPPAISDSKPGLTLDNGFDRRQQELDTNDFDLQVIQQHQLQPEFDPRFQNLQNPTEIQIQNEAFQPTFARHQLIEQQQQPPIHSSNSPVEVPINTEQRVSVQHGFQSVPETQPEPVPQSPQFIPQIPVEHSQQQQQQQFFIPRDQQAGHVAQEPFSPAHPQQFQYPQQKEAYPAQAPQHPSAPQQGPIPITIGYGPPPQEQEFPQPQQQPMPYPGNWQNPVEYQRPGPGYGPPPPMQMFPPPQMSQQMHPPPQMTQQMHPPPQMAQQMHPPPQITQQMYPPPQMIPSPHMSSQGQIPMYPPNPRQQLVPPSADQQPFMAPPSRDLQPPKYPYIPSQPGQPQQIAVTPLFTKPEEKVVVPEKAEIMPESVVQVGEKQDDKIDDAQATMNTDNPTVIEVTEKIPMSSDEGTIVPSEEDSTSVPTKQTSEE